ncbi:hypothetical protein Cob_v005282 [Colletotrichum orbiculare MAFF 240422]|uniref:Uncharacterized protein n=1 Tax=Colletotrichum orbiculare (strain 104-T / ATCC 96160 / CBS 514.97 / LARS 414 / MAFF 240422) TaxID=1213857 RepID=A0A484FUM0_COLOR|nr:hypothetical protein Cob_v005282 [Colletotrichum orbiculare MAFF 240422]
MAAETKYPLPVVVDGEPSSSGSRLPDPSSLITSRLGDVLKGAQGINRMRTDWHEGTAAKKTGKLHERLGKQVDPLAKDLSGYLVSGRELNETCKTSVKQMAELCERNIGATTSAVQDAARATTETMGPLNRNLDSVRVVADSMLSQVLYVLEEVVKELR